MNKFVLYLGLISSIISNPKGINALSLIPGGQNIVFEIKPDGLIVTGSYDISNGKSIYNPSKHSDIIKGDIIRGLDGEKISDLSTFIQVFNNHISQDRVTLQLQRKKVNIERQLRVIKSNNSVKTGLYVKERVLGIGTISFYDPVNKKYGALGHEVVDNSSGEIIDVKSGSVYLENVIGINKGVNGKPGEKLSEVDLSSPIGNIKSNTSLGIFGDINEIPSTYKAIEVADISEIKLGEVEILTCLDNDKVLPYKARIVDLKAYDELENNGIKLKITDSRIINKAGGIYAGMSGSPIIQNNKLVGAVTYVLINNIDYGYGIYMKAMYQAMLRNS